jgi:putative transposase
MIITLWEGRFRSCLGKIGDTEHQLCVGLYPLRANMVTHPRQYPWSSYRVNAEGWSSITRM